jgi:hypothetical protein
MRQKLALTLLAILTTFTVFGGLFATPVNAQAGTFSICSLLGPIGQPFGCGADGTGQFGDTNIAADYLLPRVQFVLSLLFIGLILFAVFYVVKAAVTYIQSQGQPDKIAEATKAIRSVFVGLGALFVGIAGILLVLAFFGGSLSGNTDNQGIDLQCLDQPQCCPEGKYNASKC